jgi:hypothetical protein
MIHRRSCRSIKTPLGRLTAIHGRVSANVTDATAKGERVTAAASRGRAAILTPSAREIPL